jgi:hypothetical protein
LRFAPYPASAQTQLRSSCSPGFRESTVSNVFCFEIERIVQIVRNRRSRLSWLLNSLFASQALPNALFSATNGPTARRPLMLLGPELSSLPRQSARRNDSELGPSDGSEIDPPAPPPATWSIRSGLHHAARPIVANSRPVLHRSHAPPVRGFATMPPFHER